MTLRDYLKSKKMRLTQLEVDTLECILSQGSFYEESASFDKVTQKYYVAEGYDAFIGWWIDESEVKGCRGALSSLVKKGVLNIVTDRDFGEAQQAYYIRHTLEFVENTSDYHKLLLD